MSIKRARRLIGLASRGMATGLETADLYNLLPPILDDAEAWREGQALLSELRERVIPCGHKIEDLIRGGEGSVTKCGACLAERQTRKQIDYTKVIEEPALEIDPHADCTLCHGSGWINGVVGSSCDVPNVGIATALQMDEMPS